MIPYLIWALIPKRYLVTAAAIAALLLGGWAAIALHNRSLKQTWFDRGYAVAHDSARMAGIVERKLAAEQHARDSVTSAAHSDSVLRAAIARTQLPPRVSIKPLSAADTDLVPTVPLSALVRVYVASDTAGAPPNYATPALAALVVWQDSAIYKQLLPQRDSALAIGHRLLSAYTSEHLARQLSDSSGEYWHQKALALEPAKPSRFATVLKWAERGALVIGGYQLGRALGR